MKFKLVLLALMISISAFAQKHHSAFHKAIDEACKELSPKIVNELKRELRNSSDQNIRVFIAPFTKVSLSVDNGPQVDSLSLIRDISNSLAQELKVKAKSNRISFVTDEDNKVITYFVDSKQLLRDDYEVYKQIFEMMQTDYLIFGNYSLEDNTFTLRNVKIVKDIEEGNGKYKDFAIGMSNSYSIIDYSLVYKSMLLPGLGQMLMFSSEGKESRKGAFFMGSYLLSVSGGIGTYILSWYYLDRAQEYRVNGFVNTANYYSDLARYNYYTSVGLATTAAIIWTWNVLDIRSKVIKTAKTSYNLSFVPSFEQDNYMLSLKLSF